jgi:hypothetical protein
MDVAGQRIGAPVGRPDAAICTGQDCAAHAAEFGAEPPRIPIVFLKHPNTLHGRYDDVRIPLKAARTDREVELAVVIASQARYLQSEDDALSCVPAHAVSNDVSERAFQSTLSGGQWSKGKCCEDFQPLGPWLVVDEIADPRTLGLRSWVNGEQRQDSNTSDMIFTVATLIHHLWQAHGAQPRRRHQHRHPTGVAVSGRFPLPAGRGLHGAGDRRPGPPAAGADHRPGLGKLPAQTSCPTSGCAPPRPGRGRSLRPNPAR